MTVEWADADRFFKGIELYNSFKSDKIVFTGGEIPIQYDCSF